MKNFKFDLQNKTKHNKAKPDDNNLFMDAIISVKFNFIFRSQFFNDFCRQQKQKQYVCINSGNMRDRSLVISLCQ